MSTTVPTAPVFAARRSRHPVITLIVAAACAVVALMLIGARSADVRHAPVASPAQTSVQPRTASERVWNEAEDLKAAVNVGLAGIY